MLCAWNAFKSLSAAFYSFHRPSALKEWFRWWWHMALSFGIRCLVDSRRASKPDTEVVGSAERTLTDVSWASSLLVRCVKATGHHIWHLSLRRLPHFRVCRLSNRLPKAVSYGPLRHGDWRSKPLEHMRPCSARSSLRSVGPAICKPTTICHRRETLHVLGVFISQPKLTLCKHREQWRKARRVDVVSYMWDTCSCSHTEINWINFSARSSWKLSLDN